MNETKNKMKKMGDRPGLSEECDGRLIGAATSPTPAFGVVV